MLVIINKNQVKINQHLLLNLEGHKKVMELILIIVRVAHHKNLILILIVSQIQIAKALNIIEGIQKQTQHKITKVIQIQKQIMKVLQEQIQIAKALNIIEEI